MQQECKYSIIKHGKDADTATLSRIATALEVDLAELFVSREQSYILRAYRENRIERLKEAVMTELSATVTRLLREDYERLLQAEAPRAPLLAKPRKRARKRRDA